MGELIYRSNINQDWIGLVFFSNLFLVSALFKLDPVRFKRSIMLFKTDIYISKYSTEKNLKFLNLFNLISFFIIINTICLFLFSFTKYEFTSIEFAFEYLYLFIALLIFLSFRYFFFQLLVNQINFLRNLKALFFKSFTHHFQFALYFLVFLYINFYTSLPKKFFLGFSFFVFGLWVFYQSRILFLFFKSSPKEFIYIILYLCTLKLIPWYWFYIYALEPRL